MKSSVDSQRWNVVPPPFFSTRAGLTVFHYLWLSGCEHWLSWSVHLLKVHKRKIQTRHGFLRRGTRKHGRDMKTMKIHHGVDNSMKVQKKFMEENLRGLNSWSNGFSIESHNFFVASLTTMKHFSSASNLKAIKESSELWSYSGSHWFAIQRFLKIGWSQIFHVVSRAKVVTYVYTDNQWTNIYGLFQILSTNLHSCRGLSFHQTTPKNRTTKTLNSGNCRIC